MQTLDPGQPITFGASGTCAAYAAEGWSLDADRETTWTNGYVAVLRFRLAMLRQDLRLTVNAHPFVVPEKLAEQEALVFLNGGFVAYMRHARSFTQALAIDRDALSARANTLSFVLPRATSPHALGLSADRRLLALAFQRVALSPAA